MNAGDKRHADGSPDWAAVEQLFHEATALDDVAREAALAAAGEPTAGIVRRLLAGDADASILDRGIEALAADLIGQESRDALPAERFGPYRVTGLLGRGGMGTVYLAERDDVGSVVALKVLWDAPLSPARRERFMYEQRTLARLRHPCIVPLYDAGVQPDGTAWFAMEHVDGEHVDRWCLDRGTDTPGRLKLFAAICDAVRHAHQRLVVHGDLKPSNILVDGAGRVRLLDFGVAGPVDLVHRTTGAGAITPAYASPALGADGAPTVHSDIYALGVILLQLLTGQWPPLERREPSEIRAVLREARAVQPSNVDWDDLGVICSGALSLDEDTRYQSVEALLHDLERVRAHYPIGADPSLAYRARKYVRRHRRSVAVVIVTLLVAGGVATSAVLRAARADAAAHLESERTGRIQGFIMDLLTGAAPATGSPDSVRVVDLLEQGLREAQSLERDAQLQGETYQTLGTAFMSLGALERADTALRLSLRAWQGAGDSIGMSSAVGARAVLKAHLVEKDSSRQLAALAVRLARTGGSTRALRAALEAQANAHELMGTYDTAVVALTEALPLSADTATIEFANQLNHLANNLFYVGRFDSVVVVSQRVLALPVAAIPEVHPVRGDAYINLAAVAKDRGDTAQAVRLARSGSRILEQWFGPQHHRTAGGIAEYGRAFIAAQAWDDAERELRRALAIRERVYGADHPLVANLWSDLANVAIGRQRPAEAEPIFRRIIEMYRRRHDDRHYLIGLFRGNLAGTLLRLNRPVEAEQELRAGLAMYALTLPPDHQNVGIHLVRLARALVAQRRYREAIDAAERGLGVLQKQSVPPKAWVDGARQAQLDSYVALGDSSNARATRASLSAESPARPPR